MTMITGQGPKIERHASRTERRCTKCQETKLLQHFGSKSPRCKACAAIYCRERRKDPAACSRAGAATLAWYHRNKAKIAAGHLEAKRQVYALMGNRCACCGESEEDFLTIDHVKGGGRDHRRLTGYLPKWLLRHGWDTEEYRLLCMNCNFAVGRFGSCPHTRLRVFAPLGGV